MSTLESRGVTAIAPLLTRRDGSRNLDMRSFQGWWRSFSMAVQQNPPHCVELIMLVLAMVLLSLALLGLVREWPYFVLSFSFAGGAAVSCLVRETIAPSPNASVAQVSATVLLLLSCYGFVDWFHHAQPF